MSAKRIGFDIAKKNVIKDIGKRKFQGSSSKKSLCFRLIALYKSITGC